MVASKLFIQMKITAIAWILTLAAVFCFNGQAFGVRIKDIADIKGVRQNQLVGYGLVVGLDGTGDSDSAIFTIQSMASMLEKMGVTVKAEDIEVENVAAVMVTTDLPPFARTGSRRVAHSISESWTSSAAGSPSG